MLRRQDGDPGKLLVLVIRQYHGGPASFPKGHVEPGEAEEETALREIFEETLVEVTVKHGFRESVFYSPAPGVEKEVVYFLALSDQKRAVPRYGEIAEAFWIDAKKANSVLEHENDKRVLNNALEYAKNNGFITDEDIFSVR